MTDALARRGPDGAGAAAWGSVLLGHRRLAIFDLSSAGHQPMLSEDGTVGVSFNGAVYNFRELRAELQGAGVAFRSQTDTEVLLHGYRAWGIDRLVARIRGMFAFAVWDERERVLFLVRDRLGIKPLCYTSAPGRLNFASTPRALRRVGVAGDLDAAGVAEFLEHGYVPDHASIWSGVRKLPPATVLEWRGGEPALRRYWTSPVAGDTPVASFDEAVDATERLLLTAVETRLQADVPVGALLSGGVDSGLVCWAIRELGADVTAFTVGTPNDPLDESADAAWTAARLGIRHRILPLDASTPPAVDELSEAFPEPFASASALGMLRVSRLVREAGVTVLLTGDGGDDAFLGYERHAQLRMVERLARALPPGTGAAWRAMRALVPAVGALRRGRHLLDYATGGLGAYLAAHDGLPRAARLGMLGPQLRDAVPASRRLPWDARSARHLLGDYLAHDLRHQFVGEYLAKVDGSTMHHALEARSPFFDLALWEYASGLPYDVRLHGGRLKAVLRAIAARRIGERTATGAKRGFVIPVHRWIASRWAGDVRAMLSDSLLAREGLLDERACRAVLDASTRRGEAPLQLWYAFVLEAWLRHERGAGSGARAAGRAA